MLTPKFLRIAGVFLLLLVVASCSDRRPSTVVGDWSNPTEDPNGTYLVIKQDHTFSMGDITDGKRLDGLTGRWQVEGEWLTLDVETSECCKAPEGSQLKFRYGLVGKDELTLYAPDGDDPTNAETLRRSADPQ